MALSRRNGRPRATLAFLVLLSVTAITLDFRSDGGGLIETARGLASDVFSPVRDAAARALEPVGDGLQGITGYGSLEDEADALRAELAEREGDRARYQRLLAENAELRSLNRLSDELAGFRPVTARVVSAPVSNFEQTVELDRGADDGVQVDDPVLTGAGLVGRVVQTSGRRSVVRLINDGSSSVGVRFADSQEVGTADGEGVGRNLAVSFVDLRARIAVGEYVLTAGQDFGSTIYPPGIPVGRVVTAERLDGELDQRVTIEPLAELSGLNYVRVLTVPR